jgi:hypothetical protein
MRKPALLIQKKIYPCPVTSWTCPSCHKVTILNLKGNDYQAKRIEHHINKFHETTTYRFFQQYPMEETLKTLRKE